ncbi:UDP-2,4-diacetamido-2,4,6-trideoxy-beta-L-altropyranose hydrolase [Gracilibacillus alcaliphilus]|uniref:UDP-2,4-diacetamido-2,4, 6-trideoxy-beta-L-altropyranose hydrolase n=1 Tax=Gracilibacillus alcaliphilus TaxID=1401441 RepID=UPI001956360B|nr:UDP-2,4-diacetamido-2,4,6-trideoxy-beta-L-altropyranose hydrolase [Gracilibacillus alcaliphilus]MBM7676012.1 UDP-2,4-diacetamido-2,4,6-trideoxy-beta-L-altropyranose hydrolase [Gracilibacillus alcaliphilus]
MQIVFRADASTEIGSGHIQRCLTLADQLAAAGADCCFIMRKLPGDMREFVEEKGYPVYVIDQANSFTEKSDASATQAIIAALFRKVDLLIVDHYQIAKAWEEQAAMSVQKLMVIDDLANREHACHILLDQNYYTNYQQRYAQLVPATCQLLLGPKYLLLRPEFYQADTKLYQTEAVKKLLIFFGGSDPTNETEKILRALKNTKLGLNFQVDVVIGASNPKLNSIRQLCLETSATLHVQIDYMARLIRGADFAFGAGGMAMWERGYLLLPSAVTAVAENQKQAVLDAEQQNLIMYLGCHQQVTVEDYQNCLRKIADDPMPVNQIKRNLARFFKQDKLEEVSLAKEILTLIAEGSREK